METVKCGRRAGAPRTQSGVIPRSNQPEALQKIFDFIQVLMAAQRLQDRISGLRSAVMVSANEDYFGVLPSTKDLAKHSGSEHTGSHLIDSITDDEQFGHPI